MQDARDYHAKRRANESNEQGLANAFLESKKVFSDRTAEGRDHKEEHEAQKLADDREDSEQQQDEYDRQQNQNEHL